jgi:hypothetical protein
LEHLELGELVDRLGQPAQFEVGQKQLPGTAFPDLLDAAQGFRCRVGLFKRPYWHTSRNVEIIDALLLCRFSNGPTKAA